MGLGLAAVVAVTATVELVTVENVLTPAKADAPGRQPTLGRVGGTVVGMSEPVGALAGLITSHFLWNDF